ncbi:MAG: AAA family ATPase [Pseudomonadota bacterium]
MQRVMIIGSPGSGKSTLARKMGEITFLPVVYIDQIHWQSGWVERSREEKARLCHEVHMRERWIFEGGHSTTWDERLARADTLIWLDFNVWRRLARVTWRSLRYWGQTRPDMAEGCPERLSAEFFGFIWRTRNTARARQRRYFENCPPEKDKYRFTTVSEIDAYLRDLREAATRGALGVPHR